MAMLGTVQLTVEKERGTHQVQATKYAVEKGEPFTDHVKKTPSEFSLSGYILDGVNQSTYTTKFAQLTDYMNKGAIVKYVGKTSFSNVIILDITEDHSSDVENGLAVSIKLQRVRVTTTAWQKVPPKTKPAVKPVTQAGKKKPVSSKPSASTASKAVYHVMKKGETYSHLRVKYGTSVTQLRAWNKYPDTKIPIGARLRVK